MYEQPRWPREAIVPILAGLAWLWCAGGFGPVGFLLSVVPGVLLLGSGVSLLLWPGDDRITQFGALGGFIGVVFGLPTLFTVGLAVGLVLTVFSAASYLATSIAAIRQEPHVPGVPAATLDLKTAAQVGIDEVLLSTMNLSRTTPWGDRRRQIQEEIEAAAEFFGAQGWLEKPADYHRTPPALEDVTTKRGKTLGIEFEELRFESGYEPAEGEPGRERWLGYVPNRTAYARVLRAKSADRPWLVAVHGYQMGWPFTDVGAFQRVWKRHDLNVIMPVLPIHGPRKIGRRSGDGYLEGNVLDTVHAEAQAMWDMRRLLGWVRAQGAPRVGAFGLSLGGYNASLLSTLDADLACVIAGIPATDVSRLMWRHGAPLELLSIEHDGLIPEKVTDVLRVVSPLELETQVPHEHRAIFGGTADRLVPPDQVADLWEHWDRPTIHWYQGAHVTFMLDPAVERLIDGTLRGAKLIR